MLELHSGQVFNSPDQVVVVVMVVAAAVAGVTGTYYINQAGLQFRDPSASATPFLD